MRCLKKNEILGGIGLVCLCMIVGIMFFYMKAENKVDDLNWTSTTENYDVIVVGGEPEGVTAAVSAARMGAKTLLLCEKDAPGGLMVHGMLNTIDMNRNKTDGEILTKGIFEEFYDKIGATESFDVETAKKVFIELIDKEKNITFLNNKIVKKAILNNDIIIGVETANGEKYYGSRIIDATADGDVCALAGVPFFNGMEDMNLDEKMAATLIFKVGNVDWQKLKGDVDRYKKETGDVNCGYNKSSVWAFGKWCYDKYTPSFSNMKLRGLNIGKQDDGTILINALQIFDVDVSNKESIEKARNDGMIEVENIVGYLKTILNSFENAYLVGVADDLYIRETRHIVGEYMLTATDMLENSNFEDKIALGSYPIDIQATGVDNNGFVIGVPKQYSIPLRCIIPLKVDNLFIVGKAASFSSVSAGSARVIPVGMVCGESAGITAVYSLIKDVTPREVSKEPQMVKELINLLKKRGVYLPEFNIKNSNVDYPGYSQIKKLINLGMLNGGYKNDYKFDDKATLGSLCNIFINALKRSDKEKYSKEVGEKIKQYWSKEELRAIDVATVACELFGNDVSTMSNNDVWNKFMEYDVLGIYENEFQKNSKVSLGQLYYVAVNVIEKYVEHEI